MATTMAAAATTAAASPEIAFGAPQYRRRWSSTARRSSAPSFRADKIVRERHGWAPVLARIQVREHLVRDLDKQYLR
jgi:hypothetical protein